MNNLRIPLIIFTLLSIPCFASFLYGNDPLFAHKQLQDTAIIYKDGTYSGQSRASYTSEPFWGMVKVTIKNGSFTDIRFTIRDSDLHETFNERYEKHFQGNPYYIQQSRNDWNGVQFYPKKLKELQSITRVDGMTGATWSYKIFKASFGEALKSAR